MSGKGLGTLEKPLPYSDSDHLPQKCLVCDSRAFALYFPKDLDKEYEYWQTKEERTTMFPKLYTGFSEGHYYHYVIVQCAKCGMELETEALFRSLTSLQEGDWKPPNQRRPSNVENPTKKEGKMP